MKPDKVRPCAVVRHIVSGKREIMVSKGHMKIPSGQWVDAVMYKDEENNYFSRELSSFLENFEKCAGLCATETNYHQEVAYEARQVY